MSFIETTPSSQAQGEVRELYERQQGAFGFVPNYAKVYCHRPKVMRAWANLQSAIKKTISRKHYELATLSAARALNSSYCSIAHANTLKKHFYSTDELKAIIKGQNNSPLSDGEKALMSLAEKVAVDSSTIVQADIDELKKCGFSDGDVFDVVAAAAARCFFAKLADGLGALPDAPFKEMGEGLMEDLLVGRLIDKVEPEVI